MAAHGNPSAEQVAAAIAEVRADLVRADTKAAALLALVGAAVAVVASSPLLAEPSGPGWLVRAGLVLLTTALVLLLLAVRPRVAGAPWRRVLTPEWEPEAPRERLAALARITSTAYLRILRAVDVALVAVVLIGAGIVWAAP
jgi:hypothetical protein